VKNSHTNFNRRSAIRYIGATSLFELGYLARTNSLVWSGSFWGYRV